MNIKTDKIQEGSEECQAQVDKAVASFFNHGFEVCEWTREKFPNTDREDGWYWLAFNKPRKGFWFIGPFETEKEADADAISKAVPMFDPRRQNEIFDGVLPGIEVKYAWGMRGAIDTPLQEDDWKPEE